MIFVCCIVTGGNTECSYCYRICYQLLRNPVMRLTGVALYEAISDAAKEKKCWDVRI